MNLKRSTSNSGSIQRWRARARAARHSPLICYWSRRLVTWSSFSVGGDGDTSTRLYGGSLPDFVAAFLFPNLAAVAFFDYNTVRVHTTKLHGSFFSPEFGGLCPFLDYQTVRRQPPRWWKHFSSWNPIVFDNIIMHLLHSCTDST